MSEPKTTKIRSRYRCQNCDINVDMRHESLPEGAYTADGHGPYCWGCLDEAQEVEDRNAREIQNHTATLLSVR